MTHERAFQLPGIQDLNKDQEDVLALPNDGNFLVIGGPGTGKSVVALMRARKFKRENISYVFLVYNHLLDQASSQLYPELTAITWMKWFRRWFRNITKKECPILALEEGFSSIDWEKVSSIVEEYRNDIQNRIPLNLPHLIIDEGQDMPPQFYNAIYDLGFQHIFVVADQNQQIIDGENSTLKDISDQLDIECSAYFKLRKNYRNTLPIAKLARSYCPKNPASPPPDLPKNRPSKFTPIYFVYQNIQFNPLIRRIIVMFNRDPRRLIGIITPNNRIREKYVNALNTAQNPEDPTRPFIQTYPNDENNILRFDVGGIMVINVHSCKGLEFDDVFLADIEEHHYQHDHRRLAMSRFYVMVSRARKKVILLRSNSEERNIDEIHPKDPLILKRYPSNNEEEN